VLWKAWFLANRNVGGNTELVRHDVEGRVVEYGDVDQLVEEMQYLVDNPEERRRYGENARKRMLDEFSVDRMVEGFRSAILDVVG